MTPFFAPLSGGRHLQPPDTFPGL